jgi:hypothetical protein
MQRYRSSLALLWLLWAGGLVLFLVWRLLQQDGAVAATIGWLTPHLAPTLSLVCTVVLVTKSSPEADGDPALRAAFVRALIASVLYLVVITAATFAVSLTLGGTDTTLKPFNAVLGLLQGVTAATLGVFFAKTPTKS